MVMQCYAELNPRFKPAMRLIDSVTRGYPTTITTTFAHGYTSGIIVRIKIPKVCEMEQLHNYVGPITVTGATTFTLDVDSSVYTPFIIPVNPNPIWSDICAQVIPIGELPGQYTEAERRAV